uniref:Peptidase S49 domain-containing protein n=1 Tax=Chenopodium quinoa TaxID=63459 RepID=A0A803MXI2_CHEQI
MAKLLHSSPLQISDQLKSRFSQGLSLPQICENFIKAAYDPRISGVYLHIESLNCGWGKVEEIRRHILDFRKSGKFVVGYLPTCGEKEYYLASACEEVYAPPSAYFRLYGLTVQASFLGGIFEKVGIEPQVERIGKFKSAGDQLTRKSISEENREMLTTLLDNIYGNWLDKISAAKGKNKDDVEKFINEGVYKIERLKEEGWITNINYDDEVVSMLKERLGIEKEKKLPMVDYRRYSGVKKWTLELSGGKERIAVIRASGSISRVRGPLSSSTSGIVAEQLIEKIRSVRESKRYKAAIIRIDSPGGDALASDLMWREIRLLAAEKPVIASMGDVAASGGYYMAMGAVTIVAENLTLTGSIGVVTGKFNLGKLYEKIGFNKEIISRGKFAELTAAEQRSFRPEEAELFAKSAQHAYTQFRDKAAYSRSMPMEENAQGRVWTGSDAASRGLVDALGGMGRAVAIAKQKANIPQEQPVTWLKCQDHPFVARDFEWHRGLSYIDISFTCDEKQRRGTLVAVMHQLKKNVKEFVEEKLDEDSVNGAPKSEEVFPSGEFEFKEFGAWKSFVVKCRMLIAFPWQRVKKNSVFTIKLRGQAAYDPRISGVYLHIESLNCGWGKVEEIRRHILDFPEVRMNVVNDRTCLVALRVLGWLAAALQPVKTFHGPSANFVLTFILSPLQTFIIYVTAA